jgi:hypothetical protein
LVISKSDHLKALANEIERADIHKGDTYLQLIVGLQKKALDALALQNASSDPKGWAMISRETRGYLELLGKALDRIKDQPQINFNQLNIYESQEWVKVGEILAGILGPYPEVRAEVARELIALQEAT